MPVAAERLLQLDLGERRRRPGPTSSFSVATMPTQFGPLAVEHLLGRRRELLPLGHRQPLVHRPAGVQHQPVAVPQVGQQQGLVQVAIDARRLDPQPHPQPLRRPLALGGLLLGQPELLVGVRGPERRRILLPLLPPPLVLPVLLGHARLLVGLAVPDQQASRPSAPAARAGRAGSPSSRPASTSRSMVTNSCRAWARSSALSS